MCRAVAAVTLTVAGLTAMAAMTFAPGPAHIQAIATGSAPQRIISLVPALTEILFEIGAGPRVVAVSSFDRHPPEVGKLPRAGGLLDPDVERILALRPDLVVVYATQSDLRAQLDRALIPTFVYEHGGLADIATTIRQLGERTGAHAGALELVARLERQLEEVRTRVQRRPRPRTLLVFGRQPGTLRDIFASGGVGFLHDMLEAAGGANVFAHVRRQSVQVTTEAVLKVAPEVLVELHYGERWKGDRADREREVWRSLASVPAVRHGRVHLLVGDEFVVPGPRVGVATERLARVLHAEAYQ